MLRIVGSVAAFTLVTTTGFALPVDHYVTVQIIDVCNGTSAADSTHCAPVSIDPTKDLYDYSANRVAAVTEAVWKQAGIAFVFLPTINRLYDGSFLDTTVEDKPTDEVHRLFRDPGHQQNPAANTLNLFYVDSLTTTGLPSYGYALLGSNGAAVSSSASDDTIAHEFGHNLGLVHVDNQPFDTPANLMRSFGRSTPGSLADVTTGQVDQLYGPGQPNAPDQIGTAWQPLFTVQGAAAGVQNLDLIEKEFYKFKLNYAQNGSQEQLEALKIRYTSAQKILAGNLDTLEIQFGSSCYSSGSAKLLGGTGAIQVSSSSVLVIDFHDKTVPLTGGLEATINFEPGCIAANKAVDFSLLANSTLPFSFEFDFTDGTTSTGLYDATTGTASSTDPITVSFVGQPTFGLGSQPPPELPHDPGDLLDVAANTVPEPPVPYLVAGMMLIWQRARRRVGLSVTK